MIGRIALSALVALASLAFLTATSLAEDERPRAKHDAIRLFFGWAF